MNPKTLQCSDAQTSDQHPCEKFLHKRHQQDELQKDSAFPRQLTIQKVLNFCRESYLPNDSAPDKDMFMLLCYYEVN